MRFIDANVIAYAAYQNPHQVSCQKVLLKGGITDTVALIEAFNIIELATSRIIALRALRALLKADIQLIAVDVNLIFETLKRTEKYQRLKFIDLVHYTVAMTSDCDSIVSYDKDFEGLEIPRKERKDD